MSQTCDQETANRGFFVLNTCSQLFIKTSDELRTPVDNITNKQEECAKHTVKEQRGLEQPMTVPGREINYLQR